MSDPLRVLFYNEGAVGPGILGHSMLAEVLGAGLRGHKDVDPVMIGPASETLLSRLAATYVPGLFDVGLDFQPTRWHLVQSRKARRAIRRSLSIRASQVLYVNTQVSALLLGSTLSRLPTFVSVDAPIDIWSRLEVWQRVRPWTHATLFASLALERRVFERCHCVLAWTDWAARAAQEVAPAAQVVTLHPGTNLDRFLPAAKKPHEKTRVLFVGARFEEKGGADLLAALGTDLGTQFELDVVSQDAPPVAAGLRWHHVGPGDELLVGLHQQADIFCLPSHADAAGWAIIEALACGTPAIGSRIGGIPDLIGDAGIVVPARNPRALRSALQALAADPALRESLGVRSRERAELCFDERKQTATLISLMRDSVP